MLSTTLCSQLNTLPVLCMFHPITLRNFSFRLSPVCPEEMDWSELYPHFFTDSSEKETPRVEFADIGCGYGGLLGSRWSDHRPHSPALNLVSPSFMSLSVSLPLPSGVVSTFPRQTHAGPGDQSQSVRLCSRSCSVTAGLGTRELPEHCLHSQQCNEIPPQLLL